MFYQAMQIGQLETMGYSWRLLNGYAEKLNGVTSEQVKAVAKKYLIQDHMTVVTLDLLVTLLQASESLKLNWELFASSRTQLSLISLLRCHLKELRCFV